jgi:hypothetical protein
MNRSWVLLEICIALSLIAGETRAAVSDDDYVTIKNGHLSCHGKRIRFWGAIAAVPAPKAPGDDVYAYNNRFADRLDALGFNMVRI